MQRSFGEYAISLIRRTIRRYRQGKIDDIIPTLENFIDQEHHERASEKREENSNSAEICVNFECPKNRFSRSGESCRNWAVDSMRKSCNDYWPISLPFGATNTQSKQAVKEIAALLNKSVASNLTFVDIQLSIMDYNRLQQLLAL